MRNAAHICRVPGCGNVRQRWAEVCHTCWRMLPCDKQNALKEAKRSRAAHRIATASIDAVNWLKAHSPARQAAQLLGEAKDLGAPP
jgi:hypothetical protein